MEKWKFFDVRINFVSKVELEIYQKKNFVCIFFDFYL